MSENPPVSGNPLKGLYEKRLVKVLTKEKPVLELIHSIESLGCKIPDNFFRLRSCEENISGGFSLEPETSNNSSSSGSGNSGQASKIRPHITICDNKPMEYETFRNTVVHELVHAYDICRVKNFDGSNSKHMACTEIRAAALSGECAYLHEMYRGNFLLANGHRECVKRRANLSLSMNPSHKVCMSCIKSDIISLCFLVSDILSNDDAIIILCIIIFYLVFVT